VAIHRLRVRRSLARTIRASTAGRGRRGGVRGRDQALRWLIWWPVWDGRGRRTGLQVQAAAGGSSAGLCGSAAGFLVFFRRSFYRDGIQDGGGVAPAWQLERQAACLRPVSSGRPVRLVSLGRRSGSSGRRAHKRLSGKPRGGGVGCVPWPCGRQGWQRWESLARSRMGVVPRPYPDLEVLLQSWCPFPSRWGWS
jgi:hypothetical protein